MQHTKVSAPKICTVGKNLKFVEEQHSQGLKQTAKRMNDTRKEIQTRRQRKTVGEGKTQRRSPRMWRGKKITEREREREMGLEAYMQWVEFGRNWRDPAPAAGIVVKLWKRRACQWLLLLL